MAMVLICCLRVAEECQHHAAAADAELSIKMTRLMFWTMTTLMTVVVEVGKSQQVVWHAGNVTSRFLPQLDVMLEALRQCIPPPRHVLPVSRYQSAIWRIDSMPSFQMHYTSRPISLYPDGDPDRHQNLIICSLAHCQRFLKILYKSVRKFFFCAKLLTDRQTNNDDYISSLAEVLMRVYIKLLDP